MTARHNANKLRHTPIPGLAEHLAAFTGRKAKKTASCAILAALAGRLYSISIRQTDCYRERRIG